MSKFKNQSTPTKEEVPYREKKDKVSSSVDLKWTLEELLFLPLKCCL